MKNQKTNNLKRKNIATNNPAQQKAFDYCTYMMLSSYFDKAICKNKAYESKLFLYYQDLSVSQQIEMECRCLKTLREDVLCKLPKKFFYQMVEIHLVPQPGGGTEIVIFDGINVIGVSTVYGSQPTAYTRKFLSKRAAS